VQNFSFLYLLAKKFRRSLLLRIELDVLRLGIELWRRLLDRLDLLKMPYFRSAAITPALTPASRMISARDAQSRRAGHR